LGLCSDQFFNASDALVDPSHGRLDVTRRLYGKSGYLLNVQTNLHHVLRVRRSKQDIQAGLDRSDVFLHRLKATLFFTPDAGSEERELGLCGCGSQAHDNSVKLMEF